MLFVVKLIALCYILVCMSLLFSLFSDWLNNIWDDEYDYITYEINKYKKNKKEELK